MKLRTRLIKAAFNLLLLFLTITVFLIVGEIALRVANRDIYSDDYDAKMIFSRIALSNDKDIVYEPEEGWSDLKKYSVQKPENTFRIVMLGDSVTDAPNIIRQNLKFKNIIKKNLTDMSDKKIELLTAALPGYSTVQEVAVFKKYFRAYAPNLVILNFISNDLYSYPFYKKENINGKATVVFYSKKYRQIPLLSKSRLYSLIIRHSVLSRFINERVYNIYEKAYGDKGVKTLDLNKEQAVNAIYTLNSIADEDNFELVVAFIPSLDIKKQTQGSNVKNRAINDIEVRDWLAKALKYKRIRFFDLTERLLGYDEEISDGLVDYRIDHPSEKGNAVIAKEMLDYLIKENVMPITS